MSKKMYLEFEEPIRCLVVRFGRGRMVHGWDGPHVNLRGRRGEGKARKQK
jgi:hypothetical protein